ncbi:hypothetical protein TNCV_3178901 [Trichonephila clavipes]|nr:hypothetical protein TNCV_3178901 [Trichonephila clavipes]
MTNSSYSLKHSVYNDKYSDHNELSCLTAMPLEFPKQDGSSSLTLRIDHPHFSCGHTESVPHKKKLLYFPYTPNQNALNFPKLSQGFV